MNSIVQFLRVLVVILFLSALLFIGGVIGVFAGDVLNGPKATDFSNVAYENEDSVELHAYLRVPPAAGRYPGVLMLPDRWGLNQEFVRMANLLADQGYAVMVPDLYRGQSTDALPRALALSLTTSEVQMLDDVDNAFHYLSSVSRVDTDRIGIIGFNFGGDSALRYATYNPQIRATATLFGSVITDPEELRGLGGPVKGIYVTNDWLIRPASIEAFDGALKEAGVPHDIRVYDHLSTGFLRFPLVAVRGTEINDIWKAEVVDFFDAHLK